MVSFEKGPATAETRVIVLGRLKTSSSGGCLPKQPSFDGSIFYGVGVKQAAVDSLDVVHSVLLIERVQLFFGIGPIAGIVAVILDTFVGFTCRQLLD